MHVLWRGTFAQRLRLVTGLVLFAFAGTHFLNHALGLVSLDAMVAFDGWRTAITRSWPGTIILWPRSWPMRGARSRNSRSAARCTCRLGSWPRSRSAC